MSCHEKPKIVEICGIAGAGKTTLFNYLKNKPIDSQFGCQISLFDNFFAIVCEMIKLFPVYARLGIKGLFYERIKSLVYLRLLHSELSKNHFQKKIIIFDQGPLFLQAFLLTFGSSFCPKGFLQKWVYNNVSIWNNTLNGIIWLDADQTTLKERVADRDRDHPLKSQAEAEQDKFISGYQDVYDWLISLYEEAGVPVLRISTQKGDVSDTVERTEKFLNKIK